MKTYHKLLASVLAALLSCLPGQSNAQSLLGGDRDLQEATRALDSAQGPAVYTALREIWGAWDIDDPNQIEATLRLAARSARTSPAAKVYARTLGAYARVRRGDLKAAERSIAELGFIGQWLLVGPFDNEGKAGYDLVYEPEREAAQPIIAGRAFEGKERPVRWRQLPDVFRYGFIDVGTVVRPEQPICAYLASFISDPQSKAPRTLTLWLGSGGAFKAFWNGSQVLADPAYRGHDTDRFAASVTLQPGMNQLLLKVCGDESAPIVSARVAGPDGQPDARLQISARFEDSQQLHKDDKPARAGKPLGPVQQFEARVAAANADATLLEDYARYLVLTQGDDTTIHQARDLARRAAERTPTVARLLLAGQLAEDRNQRAQWIDKAAARLAQQPEATIAVKLAQAELAKESVNWRAALPLYDEVLALDPDDIDALRGKVELYGEVGLEHSALALLQRASERNPHSLMLMNMLASEARQVGYLSVAKQAEARYAAYRFDDRSYLSEKVTLATARRDDAAVQHWLQRLLALESEQLWVHSTRARAERALGHPERALGAYETAHQLVPEDVGVLRALSDLHGELDHRDEQRALLQEILQLRPQAKDVREYMERIEPEKPRPDEAFAWEPNRFLQKRTLPSKGHNRRTLLDLNVTTVYGNGLSSKFRQVVFQPLTDSAAALARQYAFAYEASRERVQLRGARVFRSDGRVDESIESGEGAANDPSIAMYTSARTFYVQFPRLDPGDVVELRYRIDDVVQQNEFADYFGEVTYLQNSDPTGHAEYVLITPKSRRFYIDHRGIPGLKTSDTQDKQTRTYRFWAEDVPDLVPEPNMPPWSELLGFVHVSTFDSYQTLGKWYWGLSREQLDLDDETRKLAHSIVQGKTSDLDKVKAVYNWVIQNTRYVALEFGIYGFKPRRCVQTVARGWGDCKDKATVIVSLLKELGIDATLVVLRTGLRGDFASKVASLAPFDHAIAYVPSLDLYLDGTAEHTGALELPAMDLGSLGVQINQGNAKLVHLPLNDPKSNVRERKVTATLAADGSATLDLSYQARGTGADDWRRRYHAEASFKERVGQDLAREFSGFELTTARARDLEDFDKPAVITAQGGAPQLARREGDRLSLAVTPTLRLLPTYASLSERKLPVRIQAFSTVDNSFTVRLPRGMKVQAAPSATQGHSEFGSYQIEIDDKGSEVVVRSQLSLTVRTIEPSRYAAFRDFCKEVDAAFTPRLVIGAP